MYYDKLIDLGIKISRRSGSEKTKCPQCSDSRKNKADRPLSVNVTTGEYNCFSGETRIITKNGAKSIISILNESVFVLNRNRKWVETYFKKYGTEELYRITLSRNGRIKEVYSTKNHRWFARGKVRELTTDKLLPKQRLDFCFPEYMKEFSKNYQAIIAGLIFGDGTIYNKHKKNQFSKAVLVGEKDGQLRKYFNEYNILEKDGYCTISGFPSTYKTEMPDLEESVSDILSWLSGYFAADGDVSKNGVPCINSVKYKDLLHIRDLCTKCGIGTYGISKYSRKGFRGNLSDIYRINFIPETIHHDLFLNQSHKNRFLNFDKSFSRKRWMVVSVENTGRIEDVYCCEEAETGTFTLEDNILTGNCHNCGWKGNVRAFERKREVRSYEKPSQDVLKNIVLMDKVISWFDGRGISRKTLDKFMIFCKQEWMPQSQKEESCICFPYFRDGEMVNTKFRDGRKGFKMHKNAELIFYNLNTIGDKKHCIITEGEIDCLSVYEAGFGAEKNINEDGELLNDEFSKWCVVSVPNGASKGNQKMEYLDNCADWFSGLHEIVIATDGDEAGESLRDELIRRLGIERCKTISYPIEEVVPAQNGLKRRCKDFNEVLVYLGKEAVVNIVNNAEFIPIDGVYYLEDIFPSMITNFKNGVQLAPTTRFGEMDDYFRWKKGDINLFTGYANWGKTFFVLQLMLTKSIYDGWKWAVFSPENYPANDFYDDIVEMYVGKWLNNMNEEEYTEACHFISEHIFYVYPEDAHDLNSINERFRHLVLKKGIDGVLVDPFNQLDHIQKPYQREDQYLSEVLKDTKRFALLNNITYNIIAHPKNPSYQEGKVLPVVDMYDIAGGAAWGNKCDQILSYHRPLFHENKNSPEVQVYVQKLKRKRTGGKLGDFPLTLIWSKKRYATPMGDKIFCDPLLANRAEPKKPTYEIQNMWLPYADGDREEVDF